MMASWKPEVYKRLKPCDHKSGMQNICSSENHIIPMENSSARKLQLHNSGFFSARRVSLIARDELVFT